MIHGEVGVLARAEKLSTTENKRGILVGSKLIHVSWASVFLFKGVTIGWHYFCGPTILNRHTEEERQYKNISLRVWGLVNQFARLSKSEREQYRVF